MVVSTIYVVRHGFRMNWVVNPTTGEYSSLQPPPTGVPADPQLAAKGVEQSKELAKKLVNIEPKIDVIYSSPYFRCLQTIKPTVEALIGQDEIVKSVRCEPGISEFFGAARFEHPSPPTLDVLEKHFNFLNNKYEPKVQRPSTGETIEELHDRVAYALHLIIKEVDAEPGEPKAIVLVSHAAVMICIGRALTGNMPEDINEEDFRCGTCALSKYVRRTTVPSNEEEWSIAGGDLKSSSTTPTVDWTGGKGVQGGWDCELNGDCTFLSGGEERTWNFYMEADADRFEKPEKAPGKGSVPPLSTSDPNVDSFFFPKPETRIRDHDETFFATPEEVAKVLEEIRSGRTESSKTAGDAGEDENQDENRDPTKSLLCDSLESADRPTYPVNDEGKAHVEGSKYGPGRYRYVSLLGYSFSSSNPQDSPVEDDGETHVEDSKEQARLSYEAEAHVEDPQEQARVSYGEEAHVEDPQEQACVSYGEEAHVEDPKDQARVSYEGEAHSEDSKDQARVSCSSLDSPLKDAKVEDPHTEPDEQSEHHQAPAA